MTLEEAYEVYKECVEKGYVGKFPKALIVMATEVERLQAKPAKRTTKKERIENDEKL